MSTLTDETYYPPRGAERPRFVVRWIDKHGERREDVFRTRTGAEKFKAHVDKPNRPAEPAATRTARPPAGPLDRANWRKLKRQSVYLTRDAGAVA